MPNQFQLGYSLRLSVRSRQSHGGHGEVPAWGGRCSLLSSIPRSFKTVTRRFSRTLRTVLLNSLRGKIGTDIRIRTGREASEVSGTTVPQPLHPGSNGRKRKSETLCPLIEP